ncbi:MAG: beta galactosidase jelly roll domain-containing protein, partial [Firmicutes bacterium]|nr:beta galactosidase jelly roll domain-containing protein [Bacillota bacterium]
MARDIISLSAWKFHLGDVSDGWYRGGDTGGWEDVTVPHDWAISRGFSLDNSSGTGYVCGGIGWYRTRFHLEPKEGQHVRITFLGVYNNSKVWCNSNYLGKRPYGYSTFTYDITDFISPDGENEICVQVYHTETADSRWYTGSGIIRPVFVTVTGEPYIDDFGVQIETDFIEEEENRASVSLDINVVGERGQYKVIQEVFSPEGELVCTEKGASASVCINNPSLWSASSPSLYTLHTVVKHNDECTDECYTKFGIRTAKFDPDHGFLCKGVYEKHRGGMVPSNAAARVGQ